MQDEKETVYQAMSDNELMALAEVLVSEYRDVIGRLSQIMEENPQFGTYIQNKFSDNEFIKKRSEELFDEEIKKLDAATFRRFYVNIHRIVELHTSQMPVLRLIQQELNSRGLAQKFKAALLSKVIKLVNQEMEEKLTGKEVK